MIARTVFNIWKQNNFSLRSSVKSLFTYYKYYTNLQKSLSSNKIYHEIKNQNQDYVNLLKDLSDDDFELLTTLCKNKIEHFLSKIELKTHLDLDKKIGIEQVGHNTIYYNKPPFGFWTTGRATFYLPTKKNTINKIRIKFMSIPPLRVIIGFENKVIKDIPINKISTKNVEIDIPPADIAKNISEIFISTDKLWLPNIVLDVEESVTLGIGIKSIQIDYD